MFKSVPELVEQEFVLGVWQLSREGLVCCSLVTESSN